MIISKTISMEVKNLYPLIKLKFPNAKIGDIVEIKIEDLPKYSHSKILVRCDICEKEKEISYSKYSKNFDNGYFYACSQKCASEKNKATYFKRTGFKHQMYNPIVVKKVEETCLEKYGVRHALQNPKILAKAENTCLENYGVTCGLLTSKKEEGMINKYGVDNIMKLKEFNDKAQETHFKKYGIKSMLESNEIKAKGMLEKYGVEHPLQSPEIMDRMVKESYRYKLHDDTGLLYQGTYEKHFLDFCFSKKINVEKADFIKYLLKEEKKIYFPDFYLKDYHLIAEVKSEWYWNKHLEKNIAKRNRVIELGFNSIIILEKNYDELIKIINDWRVAQPG